MTRSEPVDPRFPISRRALLGGGATLAAGAAIAARSGVPVFAQTQPEVQVPATPVALGPAMPPEYTQYANDWSVQNGNLTNTRVSSNSPITSGNVAQFTMAWSVPVTNGGKWGSLTANPIVNGDTVYLVDMQNNVSAIDKATGQVKWTKTYNVGTGGPNGLTVAYGNVYSVLDNTREVVAFKADTQQDLWRVQLSNNSGEGIEVAPIVYDNTVYVSTVPGNGNAFYRGGGRGVFFALDASSGDTLWEWDTTTDNLWGNGRTNSGGGLWNPPAVDENGKLYLGVANPAPYPGNSQFPNTASRPGENLYTNNLVALDPATDSVIWAVDVKPRDHFDLDNHLSPILTTITQGQAQVPIVIASGKHGFVVGVDRASGVEIWKMPVGKHQNDNLQEIPANTTIEVFPGSEGGVETCMALSNGVVYAAVNNLSSPYTSTSGKSASTHLQDATGEIVAIDASTGQIRWDVPVPTAPYAAVTVANDVLFVSGLDGVVRGLSTADGRTLWTAQVPAGVNATLALSGDTLLVPAGGPLIPSADTKAPAQASPGLYAFRLGGGAATPAMGTPAMGTPAMGTPAMGTPAMGTPAMGTPIA